MGTDAFGREVDESRTASSAATRVPGIPGGGPRRTGVPGSLIALLLATISLGGTAAALVVEERGKLDDPLEQARRGEITNLDSRSFLRARNLDHAYTAATRGLAADEVVTQLTVAPTGLELFTRDDAARQRVRRVDAAYAVSSRQAGRSESAGLPPDRLLITGAETAVRAVLSRLRDPDASVVSVQVSFSELERRITQAEWLLEVAGVRPRDARWYASVDGTKVRRSSDPAGP
ncbi:hypothetical protein [Paraconexibacter sp.]|uniref:hypothetical protein n=1 Tax=Paraconexibacter sp. TaxID=2949640 RepID=UPI0035657C34